MKDSQFMSATEKQRVLIQWETFLKNGLKREHFTKPLYLHLINHCSFIAHYDLHGFYATYFDNGEDTVHFLSQFDPQNAQFAEPSGSMILPPPSIEYGMTYWAKGEYEDINTEMIRIAGKYIPTLVDQANKQQIKHDLALAQQLVAKHGLQMKVEETEK